MKQFIKDLSYMPTFYKNKRLGLIWLEPNIEGQVTCNCLHNSMQLINAKQAYTRLQNLLTMYKSMAAFIAVGSCALVISQAATR